MNLFILEYLANERIAELLHGTEMTQHRQARATPKMRSVVIAPLKRLAPIGLKRGLSSRGARTNAESVPLLQCQTRTCGTQMRA